YKNLLYEQQTEYTMKVQIYKTLGLEPFVKLPIRHQITGNCSWANVEASVPSMLFMLLHDKSAGNNTSQPLVREVMKFYLIWKEWDKDRALEECIDDFAQASPNRRKAKASLMGSVLFQACDPKNAKDVQRAKKILAILKNPEYHFVVRSYINVFLKSGKGGQAGRQFHQLLQACGISPSQFEF
ncbi:MAG TPA: ankyrin repeat domain-containing protein, partial [Gammaproteobacteria bacterium]|nr:ankyrin repeat domain-containing protein [Gammaproteobacteria bacterium]